MRRGRPETLKSTDDASADSSAAEGELVTIELPPRPMLTLGLVMQMGEITAVQEDSPAAEAKIRPADFIDRITDASDAAADGDEPRTALTDPLTLPDDLRRMALDHQEVQLVVRPRDATATADRRPRTSSCRCAT